jgi:hypothetical protein
MSVGFVAYFPRGSGISCRTGRCLRNARSQDGIESGRRLRAAIEAAVAQVFGVGNAELFRATRGKAPVALARQVAMYLAHVACGLSFTEVGLVFGRDRTTVAHACRVVEDRRDDPVFDRVLELLEWAVPTLVMPRRSPPSLVACGDWP